MSLTVTTKAALESDTGAALLEMALTVALVAILALAAVRAVGTSVAKQNCHTAGELLGKPLSWSGEECGPSGLGL